MPKVRDLTRSAERFQTAAAGRGDVYREGVASNTDWEANALAAQVNYDAGVQEAVQRKSFGAGVRKAGQARFSASAAKKGERNYVTNVATAGPDWVTGFEPFKAVIEAVQLPKRGRRGDPANHERSKVVGQALAAKRKAMKGGG